MNWDEKKYLLAISLIDGIGRIRLGNLLSAFDSPKSIFSATMNKLETVPLISHKLANEIKMQGNKYLSEADHQINLSIKINVKLITLWDNNYPDILKMAPNSPPFFFMKGDILEEDFYSIAVVGTRKPSIYGKKVAEYFAKNLVENKYTIISGLAYGIDSIAHRTALNNNGRTIAVIGSGLDKIYPNKNKELAYEISEHGALISEFPLGTLPNAPNFPRRNYTIAALSQGVLVVEAGEKSGALITAYNALELNKEIFAVPGSIFSFQSKGTNSLIKKGATLVESAEDILNQLVWQERNKLNANRKNSALKLNEIPLNISESEFEIYKLLTDEPIHIDDIAQQVNRSIEDILIDLFSLEMENLIEQLPGKLFVRK